MRRLEQDPRDEFAAARRERDEHREPRRIPPSPRALAARHAFQVALLEDANGLASLPCPNCEAPVCAPPGDDRDRLDCYSCDARLVVERAADGSVKAVARAVS